MKLDKKWKVIGHRLIPVSTSDPVSANYSRPAHHGRRSAGLESEAPETPFSQTAQPVRHHLDQPAPPQNASPYAVTSAVPVQRHGNRHIRAVRKSQEYATSQDEAYHLLPRRNERLHHPQGALGQPGYKLQNAALLHQ